MEGAEEEKEELFFQILILNENTEHFYGLGFFPSFLFCLLYVGIGLFFFLHIGVGNKLV